MNKYSIKTFTISTCTIFLIIGSCFLLFSFVPYYFWQAKNDSLKNSIKTEGVITDMSASGSSNESRSYYPIVKYKDQNGTEYSFKSNFYSSDMYIGKQVDVYYNKELPGKAELLMPDWFIAIFLLFPFAGAVFLFVGLVMLLKKRKMVKLKAYLLQYGQVVKADITNIYQNTGLKVNGQSPYLVECCYTDNRGEKYLYKSNNLYYNPLPYIENNSVKVYLHPENKSIYYIAVQESAERVHDLR